MRRLLRLRRTRRDIEREIDDEIDSHLELRVDALVARGMSPSDARREAARRFGDLGTARQHLYSTAKARERQMQAREWLITALDDVRYALRQVRRAPAFAATVGLTLALGIGANAAMFGLIDELLLRAPSGVTAPNGVARLYFSRTFSWVGKKSTFAYASYGDYMPLRDQVHEVDRMAIYGTYEAAMGRGPEAKQVWRTLATPSFFPLLGVRPALGRFFSESEERVPMGDAVAVLSYGFWQREFGGSTKVLGRTIRLGARLYTIVGVGPRDFSGLDLKATDVWVPFSAAASEIGGNDWYRPGMWSGPSILVRLRGGADRSLVAAHASAVFRRTLEESERAAAGERRSSGGIAGGGEFSDSTAGVLLGSLIPGRAPSDARERGPRVAAWLGAMAVVVLLIACGNVINLLLSRAAARRREVAVRLALGAARARIARQLLIDSAVLVVLGGVLGLVTGIVGGALLRRLLLSGTAASVPIFDWRLLAFTLAVTTVTIFIVGAVPALAASRPDLTDALKAGAREGTYRPSLTRNAMLVAQAALSVVLLVGAGLFVRSLHQVLSVDLGYDAPRLTMATVDFSNTSFTKPAIDAFYHDAAERVRRLPGVQSVALATSLPFWWSYGARLVIPGRARAPVTTDGGPYIAQVTSEYFATAATRIVRGRGFTPADREGAARVAVVSETMARLVWPGQDAMGKCIKIGSDTVPCSNVVGIARDARRQSLESTPVMQYYVPLDQHQYRVGGLAVLARTTDDPSALTWRIRQTMATIVPDLPFVEVNALQALVDPAIQPWRIGAGVFAAFGLLALVIASVGLYGVISYEVMQRTHEFGVRVALGATSERIVAQVLRRGAGLALIGIVIGGAIARAGANAVQPLLFETSATDAGVYAFVFSVLLAVALMACAVPARHAASADPAKALRAD